MEANDGVLPKASRSYKLLPSRIHLEAIASRLEAIAIVGWRPLLARWRPSLLGWRPSGDYNRTPAPCCIPKLSGVFIPTGRLTISSHMEHETSFSASFIHVIPASHYNCIHFVRPNKSQFTSGHLTVDPPKKLESIVLASRHSAWPPSDGSDRPTKHGRESRELSSGDVVPQKP